MYSVTVIMSPCLKDKSSCEVPVYAYIASTCDDAGYAGGALVLGAEFTGVAAGAVACVGAIVETD